MRTRTPYYELQDSYCTYRALRIFSLLIVFTWGAEGRQSPMAGEILLVDASTSQRILWKFLFPHCPPNPRASWLLSYRNLNRSTMEFLLWFIAGLGLLTFSFLSIDFDFLLHLHCRWIKWQCKSCKLQPAKQWNSGGTLRQKFNLIDIWHLTFDIWHMNIWHLTFEHLNL